MMILALVVGIVLTGINGFMIGKRWERANGFYRQEYEFLSGMIEHWADMIKAKEAMDRQPFVNPLQIVDL